MERKELSEAINRFLAALDPMTRDLFVARYYYSAPVNELSKRSGWSAGKVKTVLRRTRLKLRNNLSREGLL